MVWRWHKRPSNDAGKPHSPKGDPQEQTCLCYCSILLNFRKLRARSRVIYLANETLRTEDVWEAFIWYVHSVSFELHRECGISHVWVRCLVLSWITQKSIRNSVLVWWLVTECSSPTQETNIIQTQEIWDHRRRYLKKTCTHRWFQPKTLEMHKLQMDRPLSGTSISICWRWLKSMSFHARGSPPFQLR